MAFQEQDHTTTACASIATWSALQIAGKLFQRKIPSPSAVTKNALSTNLSGSKFPNSGLTGEQICTAIIANGLSTYKSPIKTHKNLLALVYSYGKAGLPIICGLSIYKKKNNKAITSTRILHAVTINGYKLDTKIPKEVFSKYELRLNSSRIKKLYAHDDQLCPFARLEMQSTYIQIGKQSVKYLTTEWPNSESNNGESHEKRVAIIENIYIPLHPNMRIHYPDVYETILQFMNYVFETSKGWFEILKEAEWDIYLKDLNKFKQDILKHPGTIFNVHRSEVVNTHFPKYIWVVGIKFEQSTAYELIFDTTESRDRTGFLYFISHSETYKVFDDLIQKYFS
ncbi:MAG: hypothetical protein IPP04_06810 [Saprospiraceae bacterium]|nr:hypothetical protein [Saprospiraceae bacterium]